MNSITKILAIVVSLIVIGGGLSFYFLKDDGGDDGGDDDGNEKYISFFLYDNYQFDSTAGVLSQNNHLAEGIWVKGYGDTKLECFLDACQTVGVDVAADGGYIHSWNGIVDGNFCQMGWVRNKWTTSVHLSSEDSFEVKYMAIGHGRWSNGTGGTPPTPQQNPDDIKWYWGESKAAGAGTAVKFHFYDNYVNDPDASGPGVNSSTTKKFVANGYNVTGYGNTFEEALRDACKRCYGDNVVIAFNSQTGVINRIGSVSGNINALIWDGNAWQDYDMSQGTISAGAIIAIGHGPLSDLDEVPLPQIDGSDITWAL